MDLMDPGAFGPLRLSWDPVHAIVHHILIVGLPDPTLSHTFIYLRSSVCISPIYNMMIHSIQRKQTNADTGSALFGGLHFNFVERHVVRIHFVHGEGDRV